MKAGNPALTSLLAVIILLLGGVTYAETEKLQPIHNDESDADTKEIPFPDNLKITPLDAPAEWKELKPNSLAARIAERRQGITWRPSWTSHTVSGINIKGLSAATDNSAIALVEITTDDTDLASSSIIFYETTTWRVIRAIWLPGQQVIAFSFIPHTVLAAAYVRGQSALDPKKDALLLIDCESGKIKENIPQPNHGNSELVMTCSSDLIAVKYYNSPGIYFSQVVDGTPLLPKAEKDIPANPGLLAFDLEGKFLAWADAQGACTYDPNNGVLEKIALPPGFNPTGMIYTVDGLTIAHVGSPLWVFTKKGSREINIKTNGTMMWSQEDRTLYVETLPKHNLVAMQVPQYQSEKEFSPIRLKPLTVGAAGCFLAIGSGKLVMLSTLGDLCVLEKGEKQWQKTIIAAPIR